MASASAPAAASVCVSVTPRLRAAYTRCVRELPADQLKSEEFQKMASIFRAAKVAAAAAAAAASPAAAAAAAANPAPPLTFEQVQMLSRLYRSTLPAEATSEGAQGSGASASTEAEEDDESSPGRGFVHELLRGNSVVPLPVARSNRRQDPAFKRYLEEQRLKQERREYARLVADLPGNRGAVDRAEREDGSGSVGTSYRDASRDIGHGVNVLTLMATGFIVFYYAGTGLFPHNQVLAVLCGMGGLVAALMMEVCLFLVREQKKELAETQQHKMLRVERRRVAEHARKAQAETNMELKRREMMLREQQGKEGAGTSGAGDIKLD